jgi:ribose 5-phosphate isomerase B
MKIGIASDHRGYYTKKAVKKILNEYSYDYEDYGTHSEDSVDYPDYAKVLCENVNNKTVDLGIAICGTGIGMSIACNKIKGIRCAKVSNEEEAKLSRLHNDANVLALSSTLDINELKDIVLAFITTEFSNDDRHKRRIDKINEL